MLEANGSAHPRWELYRVLAEPVRLQLLALAAEEELSIGELAELLEENQSNVSRHAAALRQAGLLQDRREGTRTLVRAAAAFAHDAVVADALVSGRALCERDGSLGRISTVLQAREAPGREFFSRPGKALASAVFPMETGAHLFALGALLPRRTIALDAGTGDGRLLDVLAPIYEQVIAIDRSDVQLALARERVALRGFANVTLLGCEIDSPQLRRALTRSSRRETRYGADAVFASRVLHHSPQPARAFVQLASLCAPGGRLVVIDYARHDDEAMRDQADAWLGFEPSELRGFARAAGLEDAQIVEIPANLRGEGPDAHLPWQVLIATRPLGHEPKRSSASNEKGRRDG